MNSRDETAARLDPRIFGHRGAMAHAPENTLASFRKAAELGCRFVEIDVVLTRDGHPVIIHGNALERTTNGAGGVCDMDLADLLRLDAGSWFDPVFKGETVPTLAQLIDCLKETGMGANVEVKPAPGHDEKTGVVTAETLTALWPAALPPPLLSSFSETALAAAHKTAPQFPCAFLIRSPADTDWERVCDELGYGSVHVREDCATPEVIQRAHEKGLKIRTYTVNDPARAKQLFEWGIDGIFTDAPDITGPAARG